MAAKNKARGNAAEAFIVEQLKDKGFNAERAWGSDGRAMGEHEEVDVRIKHTPSNELIQVKRRKAVADYFIPSEHVTAQMIYIDRSAGIKRQVLTVLTLERYMELLGKEKDLDSMLSDTGYIPADDIKEEPREWYADEEQMENS